MTEQVEVVYEDGVLRPLRPLPFAEKQHLIVTVSGEVGGGANYDSRTREFEWLRLHSPAHAGKWVAVDGDRLVAEGDTVKSVLEQARAQGVPLPLLHHIPKEPSLPFAGWQSIAILFEFSKAHGYGGPSDAIMLPVLLQAGDQRVEVAAALDTGASFCLFERSVGEALGLEIELGIARTFATANSRFQAFGHELLISVLGVEAYSMAFFFADPEIEKNALGRHGWLDRVRVGIVDHDQLLYLANYDDPLPNG